MAGPAPASEVKAEKKPSGILDLIERVGNKVPHPAILFVALCVAVIILSQILYLAGARITTEEVKPPSAAVRRSMSAGPCCPPTSCRPSRRRPIPTTWSMRPCECRAC